MATTTRKTQIITELAYLERLNRFDGRAVNGVTISLTNAGDGLSEGMKVEPVELHHGQRVYVVHECVVKRVTHDPADGWDIENPEAPLVRGHVLRAGAAVIVDEDLVKGVVDEQKNRIRRAREAAVGVSGLPGTDDDGQRADGWAAEDEEDSVLYSDGDG